MTNPSYKLTLEVYTNMQMTDEDGKEVFLTLGGWQEQYTQFSDMFTSPKVVSVEKLSEEVRAELKIS